jgi:hypothetical protein
MSRPLVPVAARERSRLARATRALAQAERNEFHHGRVLELGTVARRVELLERIARLLENTMLDVTPDGVVEVERLVHETPRVRDYGPAAQDRNERIAAILADLGGER